VLVAREGEEMKEVSYSISANGWGDGKSVCLWRNEGNQSVKIARFQCECAARMFAEDFGYPLSNTVKQRLYGNNDICEKEK